MWFFIRNCNPFPYRILSLASFWKYLDAYHYYHLVCLYISIVWPVVIEHFYEELCWVLILSDSGPLSDYGEAWIAENGASLLLSFINVLIMFDVQHCVSLRCTTCWFDTFLYYNMIAIITFISTSLTPHNYLFLCDGNN